MSVRGGSPSANFAPVVADSSLVFCRLHTAEAERWVGAILTVFFGELCWTIIARNATKWMMGLFNLASFEHDEFS